MNERIKELAKQAEIYAGDLIDQGADYDQYPHYYTEKFAELIVRECMQVANEYQNRGGNCYVDNMIAKHFGVEE